VPVSALSPLTVTPRRLLTLTLVLAAVVVGVGATAAPSAAATKPCWKRLINDWYDGRIDQTYPARCYRDALRNLPEDVDAYSTARDDIERALLSAARRKGGPLDPDDPIPPGPGNENGPKADGEDDSRRRHSRAAATAATAGSSMPSGPRRPTRSLFRCSSSAASPSF